MTHAYPADTGSSRAIPVGQLVISHGLPPGVGLVHEAATPAAEKEFALFAGGYQLNNRLAVAGDDDLLALLGQIEELGELSLGLMDVKLHAMPA